MEAAAAGHGPGQLREICIIIPQNRKKCEKNRQPVRRVKTYRLPVIIEGMLYKMIVMDQADFLEAFWLRISMA